MEKSELTRFRQEQALQEEAAQRGLSGPALVSTHAFIEARMASHARPVNRRIRRLLARGRQEDAGRLIRSDQLWG